MGQTETENMLPFTVSFPCMSDNLQICFNTLHTVMLQCSLFFSFFHIPQLIRAHFKWLPVKFFCIDFPEHSIYSQLFDSRHMLKRKKRKRKWVSLSDCIKSEPTPTLILILWSAFLLFLRSLSFMMASSHSCFSSGVLAMQTNHLFLAVLWIFQPLFTMFPLLW